MGPPNGNLNTSNGIQASSRHRPRVVVDFGFGESGSHKLTVFSEARDDSG